MVEGSTTLPTERPLWLGSPGGPLLAFVTEGGDGTGPGFVVAPGAGRSGLTKSDGLFIRMARAISEIGCDVARFDWRGTGNSLGFASFKSDPLYVEDVIAVASVFDKGRPLALLGSCYGARAVLEAALRLDDVSAIALLAYPMPGKPKSREWKAERIGLGRAVRMALQPSVLKGWFEPRARVLYRRWIRNRVKIMRRRLARTSSWAEDVKARQDTMRRFVDIVSALVDRGVSILFVFGEGEQQLELFQAVSTDELAPVFDRAGGLIEVVITSEGLYGWRTVSSVERVLGIAGEWAVRVTGRMRARGSEDLRAPGSPSDAIP